MHLTRSGLVVPYDTIVGAVGYIGLKKIKKIFTIVTKGYNNTRKTITAIRILKHDGTTYILFPRFGGIMLYGAGIIGAISNTFNHGKTIDIKTTMVLTGNQKVVLDYLVSDIYTPDNIKLGKSSTILQMDPGYGKTYIGLGLINILKTKTFIIVPNTYLLKQWSSTLRKEFPGTAIGYYYGVTKSDGDIIISIVNSAINYDKYNEIGLVIYDEVHMYCSGKMSQIFYHAQALCCLGITATPSSRIDKFDPIAQWSLGKIVYANQITNWNNDTISFETSVIRILYRGHSDHIRILESSSGIVSVPLMINQIQDDPYRNNLIVSCAISLYNSGKHVFVFSDRREHLHKLAELLVRHNLDFDAPEIKTREIHTCKLMGGSSDDDITNAKNNGKIVLTTYQYSGTGVSIDKMDSIILATPRKSNMTQILGRIFRLTSDHSIPRVIVDIVDSKICLKSQYYSRAKVYRTLNARIETKKRNWNDESPVVLDA
jgi:superfamily II DNA or RNA helicase